MEPRLPRIGVFDSGIGGLTVLRACLARMPQAEYFYLGDNGNAPYGNRPEEEIFALVRRALSSLGEMGADAVVLACNTATAVCAERLREEFPFPVLGTEPAVRPASLRCKRGLLLATVRTAESRRLQLLLERYAPKSFTVHACPELAAAIERNLVQGEPLTLSEHLPRGNYDGVVLGCTHYVFFREEIAAFYGAPVFDGGDGVARRLRSLFFEPSEELKWSEEGKTNACLTSKWSGEGALRVVFCGEWAPINQKIFKQMF